MAGNATADVLLRVLLDRLDSQRDELDQALEDKSCHAASIFEAILLTCAQIDEQVLARRKSGLPDAIE